MAAIAIPLECPEFASAQAIESVVKYLSEVRGQIFAHNV